MTLPLTLLPVVASHTPCMPRSTAPSPTVVTNLHFLVFAVVQQLQQQPQQLSQPLMSMQQQPQYHQLPQPLVNMQQQQLPQPLVNMQQQPMGSVHQQPQPLLTPQQLSSLNVLHLLGGGACWPALGAPGQQQAQTFVLHPNGSIVNGGTTFAITQPTFSNVQPTYPSIQPTYSSAQPAFASVQPQRTTGLVPTHDNNQVSAWPLVWGLNGLGWEIELGVE